MYKTLSAIALVMTVTQASQSQINLKTLAHANHEVGPIVNNNSNVKAKFAEDEGVQAITDGHIETVTTK